MVQSDHSSRLRTSALLNVVSYPQINLNVLHQCIKQFIPKSIDQILSLVSALEGV